MPSMSARFCRHYRRRQRPPPRKPCTVQGCPADSGSTCRCGWPSRRRPSRSGDPCPRPHVRDRSRTESAQARRESGGVRTPRRSCRPWTPRVNGPAPVPSNPRPAFLLSHVDPRMTIGQLVGRIVQEALDRHDPSRPPRRARAGSRPAEGDAKPAPAARHQADPEPAHALTVPDAASPAGTTPTPERTAQATPNSALPPPPQGATGRRTAVGRKPTGARTATAKPCASGRAIPAAVKRQVWQRDGGRCSYVDRQTGRRCNSRHMIDIDHILPYALGGGADPGNLRLLCRVHHRHRHAPDGSRHIPEG